jgi:hypothetical protein
MNNSTKNGYTLEIRVESIKYGQYALPMGIDESSKLYMTYPAIERILDYEPDLARKKVESKKLKALLGDNSKLGKIKAKIINKDHVISLGLTVPKNGMVSIVCFEGFLQLVNWEVFQGNEHACQLALAGLADSLESLALSQFGEAIDEETRQARLELRQRTKEAFWTLGAAIKDYKESHLERSDKFRQFVYSNCQDAINRGLFGKCAAAIRTELGIGDKSLLRDHYGMTALRRLDLVQAVAAANIVNQDAEPLSAVKSALAIFNFEVMDYRE